MKLIGIVLVLSALANTSSARGFQCKDDARDYGGVYRTFTVSDRAGKYTITAVTVSENRDGREREEMELLKDGTCTFAKGEQFIAYCKSDVSEVSITKNATSVIARSASKTFIFSLKDCFAR